MIKEHNGRKIYCKACGSSNRCYFRSKICFECAQTRHKASMCRKRYYQKPKKINAVLSKVMKNNGKRKYVDMKVNGRNITLCWIQGVTFLQLTKLPGKR